MNRFDFFEKYRGILPFAYEEKKGFRNSIRQILEEFIKDINSIDDNERRKVLGIDDLQKLNIYIDRINKILDLLYKGLHFIAFEEFRALMEKDGMFIHIKKELSGFDEKIFYRMRVFENRNSIECKEMFHIPLNMRGVIKTQRYSFPGYPCLYLGTSVNACWEELHRPLLSNCMVSSFELQKQVAYISLVLPNINEIQESNNETINYDNILRKFILCYPLILSCYVKVNNYSNTYKPEYLIPQLLTEYIISRNMNITSPQNIIYGVLYTSVHINTEFGFSDKEFINWAIPVIKPISETAYCPILCDTFKVSKPTCEEFERIKEGRTTYFYTKSSSKYEQSTFYKLETKLKGGIFYYVKG